MRGLAETDLMVEHRAPDGATTKLWCVLKNGRVVFVNEHIDPAILAARAIAIDHQCAAWLVTHEREPIQIPTTILSATVSW